VIVFRGFLAAFFTAFAIGFGVPALNSAPLAAICLRQRDAVVSLLEARGLRP